MSMPLYAPIAYTNIYLHHTVILIFLLLHLRYPALDVMTTYLRAIDEHTDAYYKHLRHTRLPHIRHEPYVL